MTFEKKQHDVVLVEPPNKYVVERYDNPKYPAIGVAYIGNYLEKSIGIRPAIIDGKLGRLTVDETIDQVVGFKPKIVGLSAMTHIVKTAGYIAKKIKEKSPETITVLGGFHATFLPEQTLNEFPELDYVSVGEGEICWSKFADIILNKKGNVENIQGLWFRKNGKVVDRGRGEIPNTLDELGEPGWHLYDQEVIKKYATEIPVIGMRGCPFGCNFCSRPYGRTVRRRTPKLIVDEIEKYYNFYNISYFNFWDETFTVHKEHAQEVCKEIIKRNIKIKWFAETHANTVDLETAQLMKDAGCDITGFGIESGNDELLKQMKKGAKKENIINAIKIMKQVKIRTCAFFIFGHPNETYKTIFDSIRFASKVNCEEVAIGIMVPYPGTEIYNMALNGEGGYVKMSIDWDDYNKQLGNAVELKNISRRKLELLQLTAYFWLYIVNGRWSDLYKLITSNSNRGSNIWKLIISIVVKIIDPSQRLTKKWFLNDKKKAIHNNQNQIT